MNILVKLYQNKFFWGYKNWFNKKPKFVFWKGLYRLSREASDAGIHLHPLFRSLPALFKAVIYSGAIIIILELYNILFPIDSALDSEAINAFLTTVASISGVFLGLYFNAISGIASSFLVRASQDIRTHFLDSIEGKQYVTTVASTGIISVFYIIIKSFNHSIHPVGLFFLGILAAYTIVRFWVVGSSVFNSFEPSSSFPYITKKIATSINRVAPHGLQWKKDVMQNHHLRLVQQDLDLMDNLIDFGAREVRLSGDQLFIALKYIGGLMHFYNDKKKTIPTTSYWYKTKNKFQAWAFADYTQTSLALYTGTTLMPKTIKDDSWFEERCIEMIEKVFRFIKKKDQLNYFLRGHELLAGIAEIYAKDLNKPSLDLLIKKVEKINDLLELAHISDINNVLYKQQISFIDTQARIYTASLVGLLRYFNDSSCKDIVATINGIDFSKKDDIYDSGLPTPMLNRLESLVGNIRNEVVIEGKVVSAPWYIETLCMQKYLSSVKEYYKYLGQFHALYFSKRFDELVGQGQVVLAAQLSSRWLEFSNKFMHLLGLYEEHISQCGKPQKLHDLEWPDIDFKAEKKTAVEREREVKDKIVSILPSLIGINRSDELPDYFGQALMIGLERCYQFCHDNEPEKLKEVFAAVFTSSISASERIGLEVQDWKQQESQIIYTTEPLENILEISGFAKLYSELYGNNDLWKVVEEVWDHYFEIHPNHKEVLEYFSTIFSYRDSIFKVMPGDNMRSQWQTGFNEKLREAGFSIFPDLRDPFTERDEIKHSSKIIRVLGNSGGLNAVKGRDLFFVIYLDSFFNKEKISYQDKRNLKYKFRDDE